MNYDDDVLGASAAALVWFGAAVLYLAIGLFAGWLIWG